MAFTLKNLTSLLTVAVQNRASDIHIRSNEQPCLRIRGDLVPIQTKAFSLDDIVDIVKIFSTPELDYSEMIKQKAEIDGSFSVEGLCRLRFNIFKYFGQLGIVIRIVNTRIPSVADLDIAKVIPQIALQKRGLILVTGATGSGKSTTLAAMINHINENRSTHIITIEDPIEYLHTQKKSRISQREVGKDTPDFTSGLRSALRQDPDIILIGEMRDLATVDIALKAAETGHAVFSTLHTTNAIATIGRIISLYPPHEQPEIRKRLAEALYAVIGQRMLPGKNGKIVVAQEILITTPGVKECIAGKDDISRINTILSGGVSKSNNGSQTFDQHIMSLFQKGIIDKETALEASSSQSDFIQKLTIE